MKSQQRVPKPQPPPKDRRRPQNKEESGVPRPVPRSAEREDAKAGSELRAGVKRGLIRAFRPESKAEAILLLGDADKSALPTLIQASTAEDASELSTTNVKGAYLNRFKPSGSAPSLGGRFNNSDRKPQRARGSPTPAKDASFSLGPKRTVGLSSGSTDRSASTRLPQSVNRKFVPGSSPRRSKILPALPLESAVPPESTGSQIVRISGNDPFQAHQDKVIRGNGSPQAKRAVLFDEESIDAASLSETGERTWSVFDRLRTARGPDEIRHARLELWRREEKEGITRTRGWSKPTFRRAPHNVELSSSQGDDAQIDRGRRKSKGMSRPTAPTMSRRVSSASVYSIVIQPSIPARELSPLSDTPSTSTASSGLHVAEEDMPQRIRRILQTRGDFSFHISDSDRIPFPSLDHSYHADLSLTIQTLRNILVGDLDDIDFGVEDC